MRTIDLNKGDLSLKDKIEGFLERTVTPIGNSAKVDCPKRYIGRRVYILISEEKSIIKGGKHGRPNSRKPKVEK